MKEKQTCLLIFRAGKIIKELFRISIEKQGILNGHAMILHVLYDHGTLPQVQLAKMLGIKPASVTTLLQSMVKEELINRTPCDRDERIMLTSLTEKGIRQAEAVIKTWRETAQLIECMFEKEEYETFRQLSIKLIENYSSIQLQHK